MISAKAVSPARSIKVTLFNSTTHLRASPWRRACLHVDLSSAAHGPTKRPSRDHLCSSGKSVIVILSTSLPQRPNWRVTYLTRGEQTLCAGVSDSLGRWSTSRARLRRRVASRKRLKQEE